MTLSLELLASAREAEVERATRSRRLAALVARCHTWVFGVLPIARPCTSCTDC
jgi:hypothetical protein